MSNPLYQSRLVLAVSGSIACYKAVDLASKLTQAGALVDVVLTRGAQHFLAPLTFQSVTGRRAYTDDDLWGSEAHVLHVGLAHEAHMVAVVPATAHTLAKLAQGHSDDLLSITALAATCPLLVAPAMDGGMYGHPATQANVQTLIQRGATVVGPEEGHLASGLVGRGRLSEPAKILGHIRHLLAQRGPMAGRTVVVTAGGTREAIDPVRFIGNRSSGRQGYALAQAALDAGARVTLITAVDLPVPIGATVVQVESARELHEVVLRESAGVDALIMAAAVADFRPAQVAVQKIKKSGGVPTIELTRNPDILEAVSQQPHRPRVTVGFAAETQGLIENAAEKLARKGLDLIVANDVSASDAGFAVETNRVVLLRVDGTRESLPLLGKDEVAARVVREVAKRLNEKQGA